MRPLSNDNDPAFSALVDDLRALKAACGIDSKYEKVKVLIAACILNECRSLWDITRALRELGYTSDYVTTIIKKDLGPDPARHLWYMPLEGGFRLHGD